MTNVQRRVVLLGGAGALAATGLGGLMVWRSATGSSSEYESYSSNLRASPESRATMAQIVRCATLASNSHNTQPWTFRAGADGELRILPDFERRLLVVDPDDHHMFISLGCAAENFTIAARAKGWTCETRADPGGGLRLLLSKGVVKPDPLFDAILTRQSTRAVYDGRVPPTSDLDALAQSAARPGVAFALLTDRSRLGKLRDLSVAANSAQISDPAFVAELKSWIRFNPRAAMERGDGLFSPCTGNPILPDWVGERMFDLVYSAQSENEKLRGQIDSSSGVAVFVGDAEGPASWVEVGRSCQRFLLTATRLGLKCAFINQAVEVARFRSELAALVGAAGKRPDLVVRFGYGPTMPYSPRRAPASTMA